MSSCRATNAKPPRNFKQALPCRLTPDEKALLADQVAALDEKLQKQEADRKAASDRAKAEIELTSSQMSELLAQYRKGEVDRDVECVETYDYRTFRVFVRRADLPESDPKSLVSERAMSTSERQTSLFAADKDKPKAEEPAAPEGKTTTKKSRKAEDWRADVAERQESRVQKRQLVNVFANAANLEAEKDTEMVWFDVGELSVDLTAHPTCTRGEPVDRRIAEILRGKR